MAESKIILVQEQPRGPSQLIEVPVNLAGQQRVNFPDIQQLRSTVDMTIIIKAMRLIPAAVLVNGPTIGSQNAPNTELIKISLVLYCEGWEKAQYIPVFTLNDTFIEGTGTPARHHETRFDDWRKVDWNKSYLQFSNGTVSVLPGGLPYVVLFDVQYLRFDAQGKEITMAQ